jgi:hypothetical protein
MDRRRLVPIALALAAVAFASQRCDNVTCLTVPAPISTACMPDAIDVNRQVRIELRELCGKNCARFPNCTATLQNGVLVLDVHEDQCNDVQPGQCIDQPCIQRVISCDLPPLQAGDYTMRTQGLPDQLVRVRAGGAAACTLPTPADGGV